jgi:outer membrane protein assembly factor BamB
MYVAHFQGLDLYRAATGKLTYRVNLSDTAEGVGPVDVNGNTIYAVIGKGQVYALRHPRIKGKELEV